MVHRSCSRTTASVSENLGNCLLYPAACRIGRLQHVTDWSASKVARENRPIRAGVVRAIARSAHWRCGSTPRYVRTSRRVTSSYQRITNRCGICARSAS